MKEKKIKFAGFWPAFQSIFQNVIGHQIPILYRKKEIEKYLVRANIVTTVGHQVSIFYRKRYYK